MDDFAFDAPQEQHGDVQDFLQKEQEALGDNFFDQGGERQPVHQDDAFGFDQGDHQGGDQAAAAYGDHQGGFDNAGFGDQAAYGDHQGGFQAEVFGEPQENFGNEVTEDQGLVENSYYQSQAQYVDPYSSVTNMDSTPQPIAEWKAKQEEYLLEKDQKAEEKSKQSLDEAKKATEQFYTEYNLKKAERKKKNLNEQEIFLTSRDTPAPGKIWERINDLVDLTPKGQRSTRDVSRIRSIFVQLKSSPNAPGA
jgi:hypothetical protein